MVAGTVVGGYCTIDELQYSDAEATVEFNKLITQSAESVFPKFNFAAHWLAQRKTLATEATDDTKLSFAPKIVKSVGFSADF